jgi:hypothetical protein
MRQLLLRIGTKPAETTRHRAADDEAAPRAGDLVVLEPSGGF